MKDEEIERVVEKAEHDIEFVVSNPDLYTDTTNAVKNVIRTTLHTHTLAVLEGFPIQAIKRQLPDSNDGYGMTTLAYIPPEEVLRRQADKIEQDREDRRAIQAWLTHIENLKKDIKSIV